MRISDWSSDVCSSDLAEVCAVARCHKADAELARHLHGSGHGAGGDQEAEGVLPIERTGDRRDLLYREIGPGIDEPEADPQIGRASGRARVCADVESSGGHGSLN